jgi:biopolymer transport protein ExbD
MPPEPAWEVRCSRGGGPLDNHGPYQSWYANGQVAETAVYADGAVLSVTKNDAWGRPTWEKASADAPIFRTWWHANGTKAVAGRIDADGKPEGAWQEWDETGALVGKVTYSDGVAGPLEGNSRLLLYAAPQPGLVGQFGGLLLPQTTSEQLPPNALRLVISTEEILLGGMPVVRLEDLASKTQGFLVEPLYEALNAWVEKARSRAAPVEAPAPVVRSKAPVPVFRSKVPDTAGRSETGTFGDVDDMYGIRPLPELDLLIEADRSLPYKLIVQILYTVGQAGVSRVHFLGTVEGLQWPPRSGVPTLQGRPPQTSVLISLPGIAELAAAAPPALPVVRIHVRSTELAVFVTTPTGGFSTRIAVRSAQHEPETAAVVACTPDCGKEGGFDIAALHATLSAVKRRAPQQTEVLIGLEPEVDLQTLFRVADAARAAEGRALFPEVIPLGPLE